jgi:DNA-binding response OmpR family regulator
MNNLERIRILYIDDDRDSFEMLRVMLGMSQIEVEPASSVGEALTRAGSEEYDLYLLDSGLPDGNGPTLCRTLCAVDPAIPVLFYSGNAHPDEIEQGLAAGAAGYITKPNSEKLSAMITKLVADFRERPRNAFMDLRVVAASA